MGPEEYLSLSAFGVNHFGKYVILLDPLKKKIHKYDYSGKYIGDEPTHTECAYIYKIRFTSKSRMLCANYINKTIPTLIFECDENLSGMKVLSTTNFTFDGGFEYAHNPITSSTCYFARPLSDTLLQFTNGVLSPAFIIDLNNKHTPENVFIKGGDYSDLFSSSIRNGIDEVNSLFETDTYLLINRLTGGFILWNKEKKSGINSKNPQFDLSKDMLPVYFNSIISSVDNSFVGLLSTTDIMNASESYKEKGLKPDTKIEKILSQTTETDNPILYFCYLKE
jgi:hypothetical protein